MKIKFLGTSAAWPLPRLGCKCEICSSTDPKDTRTRTQVLVNDLILLDAGPDTYHHLKNLYSSSSTQNDIIRKIKAVLVSHEHPDHTFGFLDLTHIYNRKEKLDIYITLELQSKIRNLIGPHGNKIRVNVVKTNQPFYINNIKVEYFPVIHGNTPAFGIKIKNGKIFTYIPDFNKILPSQQKVIRHSHILAIDGSSLSKIGQSAGHISIKDGIEIANQLKAEKTYFIHIGHKTATHKYLKKYLQDNAGKNFHVAYDGLEIEV